MSAQHWLEMLCEAPQQAPGDRERWAAHAAFEYVIAHLEENPRGSNCAYVVRGQVQRLTIALVGDNW